MEHRIRFADRTPLPPGYAVEWWEQDEHYHWVKLADPDDTYSDASVRKWDCWRGAWAHYRAALAEPEQKDQG